MSGVQDYIGRTVDLLAYDDRQKAGDQLLQQTLALPGEGGKITTGIQKLVQRFVIELLTEQGSVAYAPDRGTTFMLEGRQGLFRTHTDVLGAFSRALVDVRRNLQQEETEDDPDDERFAGARVTQASVNADSVSLTVEVLSRAGTERRVIFPITTTI